MLNRPQGEQESAIAKILSAYAHAIDDGDVDAVLACMSDDAVIEYEGGKHRLSGPSEIREFLRRALIGSSTHLVSNILVEWGEDDANVRASAIVCVTRLAGSVQVRGVVYRARVIPSGDAWLIASLAHKSTWQFSAPADP
ncbi:MAG: nuclear transport factor 2 family protein [Sphingobium sp.]|uniref:nuclear transport factor 2 family protein n=1 Tax=Sphingobium sp. TaxID=1912891 RepID=UPI0029B44AD8|nr:nuclear transport factor 2 family protein [Sphingobium sp.]MDX3909545.1 nuclear transport factor 2 family protein [Sphingobium sp.]